jgi:hypothetical protein
VYAATLFLHSLIRWIVLALALVVVFRAFRSSSTPWSVADDRVAGWFVRGLDLQILLGLILYLLLSPIPRAALHDFGGAMHDPLLRFFILEHPFGMIVSVALAHIGFERARGATDPVRKRRLARIFFSLSLLIMLASIPWPGLPYGRALLRMP